MASCKDAEAALGKLRKLSQNRECVNCGEVSRLGFGAVCTKFKTFVCNHCKSAHQSFSHRVKSVTMSSWTMEEVEALKEKNGGGNNVARAKWFAYFTEKDNARKPKQGDALDKYKQFVLVAYEEGRWFNENVKVNAPSESKPIKHRGAQSVTPNPLIPSTIENKSLRDNSDSFNDMFESLTIKAANPKPIRKESDIDLFGLPNSSQETRASNTSQSELNLLDPVQIDSTVISNDGPVSSLGLQGSSNNSSTPSSSPPLQPILQPQRQMTPTMVHHQQQGTIAQQQGFAPMFTSNANDPFAELHQNHSENISMHRSVSMPMATSAPLQPISMQRPNQENPILSTAQVQRGQFQSTGNSIEQILRVQSLPSASSDDPFAGLL